MIDSNDGNRLAPADPVGAKSNDKKHRRRNRCPQERNPPAGQPPHWRLTLWPQPIRDPSGLQDTAE
jgi:hypothetical protein